MRFLSRSSTGSSTSGSTSGSGSGYTALNVNVLFSGFCRLFPARSFTALVGISMEYVRPFIRGVMVVMVILLLFMVLVIALGVS